MCLGACMNPLAKVKPTERGKVLGKWLLYIMLILVILMIVSFVGGYYTLGLYSLILCLCGWCAVRDSRVFNIELILCVVIFSAYLWVITLVDLILYLVKTSDPSVWSLIALFGGVIFYASAVYIAKLLYDDLRLNYNPPSPDELAEQGGGGFGGGFGRMMGGGGARPPPGGQQPYSSERQPLNSNERGNEGRGNIPPDSQTKQFQAFTGTGHQLG